MHQRKRNLTGNRVRERLSIKKWTDKHRHRIVYERSRHPKYHKIRASRFAVEKVVVCGDAKEAVRECGYPCPRAPARRRRVVEYYSQKAEEKRAESAIALRKRHHRGEHRFKIRRTKRNQAKKEHDRPTNEKFQRARLDFHKDFESTTSLQIAICAQPYLVLSAPRVPLNQPKSLPRKPLSSSDTLVVPGTTGISGEWKFTLSAVR